MRVPRSPLPFLVAALVAVAMLGNIPTAHALTEELLISDREFTDANALTLAGVQQFLQERSSPLAVTPLPDSSGALKLPAEIIWFAAQEAIISPKVLLTTLQKEQRLVSEPRPTPRQVEFAMGYGCPDGNGCSDRFRGFGKQIRGAALQFRGYLDDILAKGETIARWTVSRTKRTGDGFDITPRNSATAALYSYTPWRGGSTTNGRRIGGNLSFARIWRQWFGNGAWPDGTILRAPDGAHWLLQGGKRRRLAAATIAASRFNSTLAIDAPAEDIEAYAEGAPVRFPEYAVVRGPDGIRWLLVGTTRRKIASREVFRKLGFHPEEVEDASVEDLAAYAEAKPITAAADDPRGTLVRERSTNRLYLVVESTKAPLVDPAIQRLRFPGEHLVTKTPKELAKLRTVSPILLPEGTIVTARSVLPTVFIVSNGERRPFESPRALELLGYQWANVLHVSDAALTLHPLGRPVGGDVVPLAAVTPAPARTPPRTPTPADTAPRPYISGLSVY